MGSSLFNSLNETKGTGNAEGVNSGNLVQKFKQFKKSMEGKDPMAVLEQKIQSGEITQAQVDNVSKMIQAFLGGKK